MNEIASEKNQSTGNGLPRGVLLGAAALICFTLAASGMAKVSHIGRVQMPERVAYQTLSLRFEDEANGGVAVRDAQSGKVIYTVQPGTNGFIRATMRGLTRERIRADIGSEIPFTLIRWNDGTMSLEDRTTGRHVALDAFGPTNAEAFAQLFTSGSRIQ
jgi:putative photosynthetic complex assembly protein